MGSVVLDDRSGRIEAALFSETYEEYRELLASDQVLVLSGQLSYDEYRGGLSLRANKLWTFEQAREHNAGWLQLDLDSRAWSQDSEHLARELEEALRPFLGGQCPLHIAYRRPGARARLLLGPDWRVTPTDELLKRLQRLFGAERVEVVYGRLRPQFPVAAAPEQRKRA
jgi:DNA polymerase-3 subunit alpha